ncbi:protein TRANSPARENT TESTA [Musa troglodytarum]|uniref:Protein TRANSPARENT TESTA n=1 Tax=Musa troglodytarum TaxID=320322 RepID=A0A9E7JB04_9LILI|nr:protein TRANSPARENT TESTA [Musa troglodytarum]
MGTETGVMGNGEERIALLRGEVKEEEESETGLARRSWIESTKLWRIVGPAIFGRVVIYSLNVITQAFAGHLGDLELASISIANTVVVGFSFGLMLGMASALETLCGQAFGAKKYRQKLSGVAGSPAFVAAPEVLLGDYSEKVDIWVAGVLSTCCWLVGYHSMVDLWKLSLRQLKRPSLVLLWESISELARDLLSWMLTRDVSKRITADEI